MDFIKTQETLIKLLPLWQNKIARPFKQILDEGITCEMYNCMQFLVWFEDGINCARCTACINGCPHGAIEYKDKTQGKERYFFGR